MLSKFSKIMNKNALLNNYSYTVKFKVIKYYSTMLIYMRMELMGYTITT